MKKIVVTQNLDLNPDQTKRLRSLGKLKVYNDLAKSPEEWIKRTKGFDVICTGKFGLRQKVDDLKNVFISLPFVDVGWMDKETLRKNKVVVANSPGCNKDAITEWIVAMMLNLLREFPKYIGAKTLPKNTLPRNTVGLTGKKVTILGAGNIGLKVVKVCEALGMKISLFRRGDEILESIKDSDVVINTLGSNPTTQGLLNSEFFASLKTYSYFISVTSSKIYDVDALFEALDKNVAGAAIDAGDIQVGDTEDPFYKKLLKHPKNYCYSTYCLQF